MLKVHVLSQPLDYDGSQLRPRWNAEHTDVFGPSIVIGVGSCQVPTQNLVDWEDRRNNETIQATRMIHFLGDLPEWPISKAVLLQNLLILWIQELILENRPIRMERTGNDLFAIQDSSRAKLTVSIAAPYAGGSCFHTGLNVDASGAPVRAMGLNDLGLGETSFLELMISKLRSEVHCLERATGKGDLNGHSV